METPLSIPRLLEDEALRRSAFPVTGHSVFLAHAGMSPLPSRVVRAMSGHLERSARMDQERAAGDAARRARVSLAGLLGVAEDEVALVGPTSLALSQVAAGFPVRSGDNVVIYQDAYPSNVFPWRAMAGVEVRPVRARGLGEIVLDEVLARIDGRTRLVSLDSCHFISGYAPDIDAIGRALRERDIAFCVDAIQSLGAFPVGLEHVDFLAAGAHKWLMGPCSTGVLYVRREWQERLRPSSWGWKNLACSNFAAGETLQFLRGAQRYEPGTLDHSGLAGLGAAVDLILELGVEAIATEIARKRRLVCRLLREAGGEILGHDDSERYRGGMVSVRFPGADSGRLHAFLEGKGVRLSLRPVRNGDTYLRFSPHCYNTDEEIERAVEACDAGRRSPGTG